MLIVEDAVFKYSWTSDTTNLQKAKELKTVEIITDKDFRIMNKSLFKSKKSNSEEVTSKSLNSLSRKNTIDLDIKAPVLKKIIVKHSGLKKIEKNIFDRILDMRSTISSYDELNDGCNSIFYFDESNGKLIVNDRILRLAGDDLSDQVVEIANSILCEDFFTDLSKKSRKDFKVHFLINSFVERLGFCIYDGEGKFYFEDSSVENWEDPDQFETYPYFVKMAKNAGMKKVKNEYGEKLYDSEEVYDIICDFRNNLYDANTYLNIAPEEYLKMKNIPN